MRRRRKKRKKSGSDASELELHRKEKSQATPKAHLQVSDRTSRRKKTNHFFPVKIKKVKNYKGKPPKK